MSDAAPDPVEAGPGPVGGAPGPGASTVLGIVGSPWLARVDAAGAVTPGGVGWSLTWAVGADDRWHVAAEERAVRQALVEASPVVATTLRIPGGDAVQQVWAVPGDGGPLVVVEVENASPVPVALALSVGPRDPSPGGPVPGGASSTPGPERIDLVDGVLRVDGEPAVLLGRAPGRALGSSDGLGSLRAGVAAGEAVAPELAPVRSSDGRASAALVFPLPHTARLRVALPLGGAELPVAGVESLPGALEVARGWAAQAELGARVELGDPRLGEAVAAARRALLLRAQGSGDLAAGHAAELGLALARWGAGTEALAVVSELARRPPVVGGLLRGVPDPGATATWIEAVAATLDALGAGPSAAEVADELLVPVEAAARALARSARRARRGAGGATTEAAAARGRRAASRVGRFGTAGGAGAPADSSAPVASEPLPVGAPAQVAAWVRSASPTWTWRARPAGGDPADGDRVDGHRVGDDPTADDPAGPARFLEVVRRCLVAEGSEGPVLVPELPEAWLGRPLEAHDVPTPWGRLSFAVRWHGARPALLWELDAPADRGRPDGTPVRLVAPGLDPTWSSTEAAGDALLAAPDRGVRPDPGPGESFS